MQKEASEGAVVKEITEKAEQLKKANQEYLSEFQKGSQRVLNGEQRQQEELTKSEIAKRQGD